MPIRNSKTLEVVGWAGVNLRADSADLQNHDLAAASNIDLHSRIAIAAQRQGKEKLFTSGADTQWSVTDGGDMGELLGGLFRRLTRERGISDDTPVGLNRWEDRLLAGLAVIPDDSGPKGTYGWEVDSHGSQPQPLPDLDVRRLAHRGTTRYQIAGQRAYRSQKHIQDYRELDCSDHLITSMLNYRPLLDNVEWTFIADRGQMIKDDGTVTRRWGIAPPEPAYAHYCPIIAEFAHTHIRYTDEDTPKVAHESNPTASLIEGLSAEFPQFLGGLELMKHPDDPQVNGFGLYRATQNGGTRLLIERTPLPQYPLYGVCFGWESLLGTSTNAAVTLQALNLIGSNTLMFQFALPVCPPHINYLDSTDTNNDSVPNTMWVPPIYMGTQQWEPGFRATYPLGSVNQGEGPATVTTTPAYEDFKFVQNSEDVPQDGSAITAAHGRHGSYRWEVDEGFVTSGKQTMYWAYGDRLGDALLGTAVETDNDLPPDSHYCAEHLGFTFLFGDDDNEHYLYWSKRFQPESFPAANYIEVGQPSDPSRGLASLAGLLGIFTENTKYRLTGSDSDSFVYQEALSSRGCPAPLTIVPCERGVLFAAFDGVWQTTLTSPDQELSTNILPLFMGQEVNGMKPIDWTYALRMSAEYHKGRYYLSYVSKGATEIDTVAVYSFDTQQWSFYALDARSFRWEDNRDIMAYGATDGHLYEIEGGAVDDVGLAIPFSFRTKDFGVHAAEQTSGSFLRCLWLFLKLDLEITDGSATIKMYANNVLVHITTLTGSRTLPLLHLPENTWGTRCRVEVSGESKGPVRAHGLSLAYLPLEHD